MDQGLQYNDVQTAQQGQSRDQIAQAAQAATAPATPNFNSISSANLQPTTQVNLPAPAAPSGAPAALAASAAATQPSLTDYIAKLTPPTTAADTQQQSILDSIASLTGADTGKGQTEADNETANGVPALQAHLTDLNGQLTTGNAELSQLQQDALAKQSNIGAQTGIASSVVSAQQNEASRQAQIAVASKSASLALVAAEAQATSGNINTALTLAKNATDAKYAPIEDDIKVRQAQLQAIQPLLDKEQKTTALAQQTMLQQQAQDVADQKAKETQINTIAMNAAQAGATPDILAAIQKSPDVLSAINAAAPALGAKTANDLKQQAFDNALKLRTAQNDSIRVGIEQENANIALAKLQLDQSAAAKSATNAVVTTPSGKKYVDGTNLDAAGKTAALNAGQVVLSGDSSKAMTAINNVQGQVGALLSSLQAAGVDLTKTNTDTVLGTTNQGGTNGFLSYHAAGAATPAVANFGTNLKSMITDLQKLPGTGSLVATLQDNVLTGKENASDMQNKIVNITKALEDSENGLLVDNSQPAQIVLNGKTLTLGADGTYQ